jgi:hypothetical protein
MDSFRAGVAVTAMFSPRELCKGYALAAHKLGR